MGQVKEIYEMKGAGRSIREIARELDVSRNTVRRYLKTPEAMRPKPRPPRGSKVDPYTEYIDRRMAEGLENCVVPHRELVARGYDGGYSILKGYVSPPRRQRQPEATLRFETAPGEQAQVDWGSLSYLSEDGKRRSLWVFVMTMGWSRACYVELVRRTDTAAFIQCHVNAFEYLGGVPRRCLYDNAKVVTLGRDEAGQVEWNRRMLDFAMRVGFERELYRILAKVRFRLIRLVAVFASSIIVQDSRPYHLLAAIGAVVIPPHDRAFGSARVEHHMGYLLGCGVYPGRQRGGRAAPGLALAWHSGTAVGWLGCYPSNRDFCASNSASVRIPWSRRPASLTNSSATERGCAGVGAAGAACFGSRILTRSQSTNGPT